MKKLLFIILTLFSLHSFAQDTTYVKVRGIPGAYNFSKNDSGDSLIFYVAGERHALSVGSTVDLSNYYNKTQVDNSLNGKLDTSYKQSITAIKPLHWNVITPDSATIGLYVDTTSDLSDNSDTTVPSTKAVKNYVDNQISTVTSEGVTRPELIDTANNKVNISDTAAMLNNYAQKSTVNTKVNISDTASMLNHYATKNLIPTVVSTGEIYTMGNSITHFGTYQSHMQSILGNTWHISNLGVAGNTTTDMYNRYYQVINGLPNYVIVLGGINDIIQNFSKATVQNNLQAMYTDAHNAGIKVVASTVFPFGGNVNWTVARQDSLEKINKWITDTAVNIDYIVDGYTAMQNPLNPSHLNPAYSTADSLHPNSIGLNVFADSILSEVPFTFTNNSAIYTSKKINLSQDLTPTSSPTFGSLKVTSLSAIGYGDSSKVRVGSPTKYTDLYTSSAGVFTVIPTGNSFNLVSSSINILESANTGRPISFYRANALAGGIVPRSGGGISLWGGPTTAYQLNIGITGNVGIGTAITSPSEKLEVDGNVKATSFIKSGGTSSQILVADGSTKSILSGSATLDFPSTATNATSDLTITVTGAVSGDVVSIGVPSSSATIGTFFGFVSASNTVTIRFLNNAATSTDPASGTFKVKVSQ